MGIPIPAYALATTCFFCGCLVDNRKQAHGAHAPNGRTIDHLTPVSRGGPKHHLNKVCACRGCNEDKGRLTLEEYRLVIAFRRGIFWSVPHYMDAVALVRFHGETAVPVSTETPTQQVVHQGNPAHPRLLLQGFDVGALLFGQGLWTMAIGVIAWRHCHLSGQD